MEKNTAPASRTGPVPLIKIDLYDILDKRVSGWKKHLLPRWLVGIVERIIRQKELNHLLETAYPREGSEFSDAILNELQIDISVSGAQRIPQQSRLLFVSNHPLGGLDGIALIKVLGMRYGDDNIRFLVNDMLMNVGPLRKVFLPVNKYGAQGRGAARAIAEEFAGNRHILVFPAGLVSRMHDDGTISDLEWQKSFVVKAIETGRTIVPVKFESLNEKKFYRLARLRKRLGIKVNLEQVMLPGQLCAKRGETFVIKFGEPVSPERLKELGTTPRHIAAALRQKVYEL